jgi:hypothetical protein
MSILKLDQRSNYSTDTDASSEKDTTNKLHNSPRKIF